VNTHQALKLGGEFLCSLSGHKFDLLTVSKPVTPDAALNLAKVVSKLSPLLGNLIEFNAVEFLNAKDDFKKFGKWLRQDPGFPDTIFEGKISPAPGFEIKAWFPLATEITARFKNSQNHFLDDRTHVCMLAWLPEHLIYGMPYILDVVVVSGLSVAKARDDHYHDPPDYLVIEPRDTTARTRNLQQTNTNGYKFQGTRREFEQAAKVVKSWGKQGKVYKPTKEYQEQLFELISKFSYRLNTNYAKMDRIVHDGIERFKAKVYKSEVNGMSVAAWTKLLACEDDARIKAALKDHLKIEEVSADKLRA
jgi:hypothetical protein